MCSGCHTEADPKFCEAPRKPDCPDCHSKAEDDPIVFGLDRTIRIHVTGGDPGELREMESRLREGLVESDGFREVVAGPEFGLDILCRLWAESDGGLLPAASGVRLFRGTCHVCLTRNGSLLLDRTLESRVSTGRGTAEARGGVFAWLTEESLKAVRSVLEDFPDD